MKRQILIAVLQTLPALVALACMPNDSRTMITEPGEKDRETIKMKMSGGQTIVLAAKNL